MVCSPKFPINALAIINVVTPSEVVLFQVPCYALRNVIDDWFQVPCSALMDSPNVIDDWFQVPCYAPPNVIDDWFQVPCYAPPNVIDDCFFLFPCSWPGGLLSV